MTTNERQYGPPRGGPWAIRQQKKARRRALGLARSKRCPTCRQFTRQRAVTGKSSERDCLACGQRFRRDAVLDK